MKIFILGVGRMGSWLATALAKDHEVAVFDNRAENLAALTVVKKLAKIEEVQAFNPELFINCVALGSTVDAFKTVLPFVGKNCMLADIASVKTGIYEYYSSLQQPFVSTHPMFGPTHANIQDLHDENAVIISESCEAGKKFFSDLYSKLGIKLFTKSFDEHDKTVAYSLATPFASTLVFAACMKKQDAPGTNFKKHMAIAKGLLSEDDKLIGEILFNPHSVRQLELIASQLTYLSYIIKDRDQEEMVKFLDKLRANIGIEK